MREGGGGLGSNARLVIDGTMRVGSNGRLVTDGDSRERVQ